MSIDPCVSDIPNVEYILILHTVNGCDQYSVDIVFGNRLFTNIKTEGGNSSNNSSRVYLYAAINLTMIWVWFVCCMKIKIFSCIFDWLVFIRPILSKSWTLHSTQRNHFILERKISEWEIWYNTIHAYCIRHTEYRRWFAPEVSAT